MNKLSPLILPGDIEFNWTLNGYLPPVQNGVQPLYVQRPGSLIMEPATPEEMTEYLLSGEYDERLAEMGDEDEDYWEDEDEWIDFSQT